MLQLTIACSRIQIDQSSTISIVQTTFEMFAERGAPTLEKSGRGCPLAAPRKAHSYKPKLITNEQYLQPIDLQPNFTSCLFSTRSSEVYSGVQVVLLEISATSSVLPGAMPRIDHLILDDFVFLDRTSSRPGAESASSSCEFEWHYLLH